MIAIMINLIVKALARPFLARWVMLLMPNRALWQMHWDNTRGPLFSPKGKCLPWLTYGAIDYLEQSISPKKSILEIGGGSSTLFWLNRGNEVTTIESDEVWFRKIELEVDKLPTKVSAKAKLIQSANCDPRPIGEISGKLFDVIIVDQMGDRALFIPWCLDHLTTQGTIVIDNSDARYSKEAVDYLLRQGFGELSFFGMGPANTYAWTTSIFSQSLSNRDWEILPRRIIQY